MPGRRAALLPAAALALAALAPPLVNVARPPYAAHADRLPLQLQDHAHPVRFRNVWALDLERPAPQAAR